MSERQTVHSEAIAGVEAERTEDVQFVEANRLNPPLPPLRKFVYTVRFFLKITSVRAVGPVLALAYATRSDFVLALAAAVTNAAVVLSWTWDADPFEEEPWRLIAETVLWGAIPAIVLAVAGEMMFHSFAGYLLGTAPAHLLQVGVVAPIVEEICKGVVLVYLFRRYRDEFDGMVDGLLYGAFVGIGFSMTENVFYYLVADPKHLENLVFTRGILFGMNHAVFSACLGLGLGIARDSNDGATQHLAPLIGLLVGIVLHMGHNVLVISSSGRLAIPLAIAAASGWFYLVALARKREAEWIREGLAPECKVGVLKAAEIDAICSARTRAATLRRAVMMESKPGPAHFAVRFYAVATELAFARHKAKLEPNALHYRERVDDLRQQLAALRAPYRDRTIIPPQ